MVSHPKLGGWPFSSRTELRKEFAMENITVTIRSFMYHTYSVEATDIQDAKTQAEAMYVSGVVENKKEGGYQITNVVINAGGE